MLPFDLGQFLFASAFPAILALLLFQVERDLAESGSCQRFCIRHTGLAGTFLALTAGAAHLASAWSMNARLVPPLDAQHGLSWSAIGLGIILFLAAPGAGAGWRAGLRWLVVAAAAGAGVYLLLRPFPVDCLARQHLPWWCLGTAVFSAVVGWAGHRRFGEEPPLISHTLGLVLLAGTAGLIGASGSKDLALLCGIPAAAIGGGLVLRIWNLRTTSGGIIPAVVVLQAWFLVAGYREHTANVQPVPLAIAALALPLAVLASLPRHLWWRRILPLVAVILCLGTAIAWAVLDQPADSASGYDGYGS